MTQIHRRQFLAQFRDVGLGIAATWTILNNAASARGAPAADKVLLGLIGAGGRGSNLATDFAARGDVQFACVADPDANRHAAMCKALGEKQGGKAPQGTQDYRALLDDQSVDAVIVATPDHWHALATINACQAGKDVWWEAVANAAGVHPVRRALAEIGVLLAVQWGGHLLQVESGGRGIVLGNVPGIAPATFVIEGAGNAGWTAARLALAHRAHVIVLDLELENLRRASEYHCEQAVTAVASDRNLRRYLPIADVLMCAVAARDGRTPTLVTEAMVRTIKPGSVILDLSIDEGGCVETSRPTTLDRPTFQVHGVTHFCVPNMTAAVPRTASRAMSLAE